MQKITIQKLCQIVITTVFWIISRNDAGWRERESGYIWECLQSEQQSSTTTTLLFVTSIRPLMTSNNQRLGSVFDDLDPRHSLLCQVGDDVICPCKICGGCQICIPRSIQSLNQPCQSHSISTPIFIRGAMIYGSLQYAGCKSLMNLTNGI